MDRREFLRNAVGTGIALRIAPAVLHAAELQARIPEVAAGNRYAFVDPELIPLLKILSKINLADLVYPPPLPTPAPQLVERRIPGPPGAPEVRLVIVDPAPGRKGRPALLHMHGGGFTAGSAELDATLLQTIAENCGCVVVSVDYRLAPETHFLGAIEDNYAGLRWLHNNAETLGVDRKRIVIGGESAGGYHAAQLAIYARDRKEVPIIFQLLIYPALDDRTGSSRPVPPHIGEFIWTAEANRPAWTALLGVPAGSPNVPASAAPARVKNLEGLPPAFIAVGSIDLLVGENIDYAHRLLDAGVPTELHVLPGAYHGFDRLVPNAEISKRFTRLWIGALQRAFVSA